MEKVPFFYNFPGKICKRLKKDEKITSNSCPVDEGGPIV